MPIYNKCEIVCQECGHSFVADIPTTFDASIDEDALDKIIDFEPLYVCCPRCGEKFLFDHGIIYKDYKNGFVVVYANDVSTFINAVIDFEKIISETESYIHKMKYRIVYPDYLNFIEKIEVLDNGYNDVVVEKYKYNFMKNADLDDVRDCYFEISVKDDYKGLAVYFNDNNKTTRRFKINEEIYNYFDEQLKNEIYYDRREDLVVDLGFIHRMQNEKYDKSPIHREYVELLLDKEYSKINKEAIRLVEEECKYQEAIEMLLPLAELGHKDSQNDIGVVYQRIGEYSKAVEWYKKNGSNLSLINILNIYETDQCDFDVREYLSICNILKNRRDQKGYLFESFYYQKNFTEETKNKIIDTLLEGLIYCKDKNSLVFELGCCLNKGLGCNKDRYKGHKCFEALSNISSEDPLYIQVNYNYGFQLFFGKGCEVDVEKATKHLEKAADYNHQDAIRLLLEIYSSEEYKDEEKIDYYNQKYNKN